MPLTAQQRFILSAPPVAVLIAVAASWIFFVISFGYLNWLLPVQDRPIPSINEPVLKPGMKLLVHAPSGDMTIEAGVGRKRTFNWDNGSRALELNPRLKRWYGKLGIYGEGYWLSHRGISRGQAEEAQLNFSSAASAEEYLSKTPACDPCVYRNDGLTAWISKKGDSLSVDIFQVYVNGVKPLKLRGAQDDRLLLPQGEQTSEVTRAPADLCVYYLRKKTSPLKKQIESEAAKAHE